MKYIVYVWDQDRYDLSRWIEFTAESASRCAMRMCTETGEPAGPYSSSVEHLLFALEGFTYQIAAEEGYCSLTSHEDVLEIEFQGAPGRPLQWCCVKKDEVQKALQNLGYALSVKERGRGLLF